MELIRAALTPTPSRSKTDVSIAVDRHTLAKRRWRAPADDGRDFGFDLERALMDGDAVFAEGATVYRIRQTAESVLAVKLPDAAAAVQLGWTLGNLHFRIAVNDGMVHAPDDPAIRQLLDARHWRYQVIEAVFRPLPGGHAHGHGHGH